MKIIHIFPYTARAPGGHSNAIREFITCQREAGLDSIGLSPITDGEFIGEPDLPADINEIEFRDPAALCRTIAASATGNGTIVHLHAIDPLNTLLASRLSSDGLGIALTSHGQLNFRSPLHAAGKFLHLGLRDSPVRHAGGIHLLTEKERRRLRLLIPGYKGLTVTLPHVIHGPPPEFNEAARRPAGGFSDGNPFTVLHLGRLDVQTKGLDILVRGFAAAAPRESRLILAGPDWNRGMAALEDLATVLGCRDRIDFPGALYGIDKERAFASADLFVAASRWDAFNISLAEALRRGVPALISERLNLAPELKRSGAAAVAPCSARQLARAISELSSDPARLNALSLQGSEWAKFHCSAVRVGTGFVEFYRHIRSCIVRDRPSAATPSNV